MARPFFCAGLYCLQYECLHHGQLAILKAIMPCTEDRPGHDMRLFHEVNMHFTYKYRKMYLTVFSTSTNFMCNYIAYHNYCVPVLSWYVTS